MFCDNSKHHHTCEVRMIILIPMIIICIITHLTSHIILHLIISLKITTIVRANINCWKHHSPTKIRERFVNSLHSLIIGIIEKSIKRIIFNFFRIFRIVYCTKHLHKLIIVNITVIFRINEINYIGHIFFRCNWITIFINITGIPIIIQILVRCLKLILRFRP